MRKMMTEGSLPEFLWRGKAADIIKNTKIVTKNELISFMEPGDLICSNTPDSKIVSYMHNLSGMSTKMAMGIPYSSIKLVATDGMLIGYGLRKSLPTNVGLDKTTISGYVNKAREIILLKPKVPKEDRLDVIKWMEERLGVPFNVNMLNRSLLARVVNSKPSDDKVKARLSEKVSLFCSNIIAYAFLSTGHRLVVNPENAWPVDFIESNNITPISRIHQ
jgi:hypothetical protein